MFRALFLSCAGAAILVLGAGSHAATQPEYYPGRIIIQPKPGHDLRTMHSLAAGQVVVETPDTRLQVVSLPPGQDVNVAVAAYEASGEVEFAEPDYILRASSFPDDPRYVDGSLWGMHNTGAQGGTAGADISADQAWAFRTGATNVVVAIIDSGVRYTHEDLSPNMWRNPGEIPGNGIDDDHDGLIDDVHGFNAPEDSGDPWDDNGHGTHVAGIIGAAGNNGKGVVGVAWNVQLMACKFMDSNGEGATSDAVLCIDYARRHGAHIINASWGGGGSSYALLSAIRRARDAGVIFVTAAGNEAQNIDRSALYPAAYSVENLVAVAATTRSDQLADYSNYGASKVMLAAPGSQILSTWNSSDSAYAVESGTSMAAPFVAGAFALVKAVFPTESYAQLIQRVKAAVDPLGSLSGKTKTGGRVNLRKALGLPELKPVRLSVMPGANTGALQLALTGTPNTTYIIEASPDLVRWTSLFSRQSAADGTLSFADPSELSEGQRYYRARMLPVQ